MTSLNPRAVAFTPGGSTDGDVGAVAATEPSAPSSRAATYSLGSHCPWDFANLPASAPMVAVREVMAHYFQEEATATAGAAGRSTAALGHFDERLRIAGEYAYDNGALSVSPALLETTKPLQQICRGIASAISGLNTADAVIVNVEMRDAVRQVSSTLAPDLLAMLRSACSPLSADEVNPGEWDIAFSCAGSIVHLLAVATLFEKGIASNEAAAFERLSALRDAVLRHRGAGCLVKIALPLLAACRYASANNVVTQPTAVRWCRDLFPLALNFVFALPPVGGLLELVAFSHSHFWTPIAAADGNIPLGALIVHETLQAFNHMTRFGMAGLSTRPFSGLAVMMASPTLSHARPPAAAVPEDGAGHTGTAVVSPAALAAADPAVVMSAVAAATAAGRSPAMLSSLPPSLLTGDAAALASAGSHPSVATAAATTSPSVGAMPGAPHLPHLLEEVGSHDPSLMLSFALLAMTECSAVTVATAKRAVEAVELACDGDPSQLEKIVARRPQPVIRDLLTVCESLIGRSADQTEQLRRASECVLAREHGAAHASSLIVKGPPKANGGSPPNQNRDVGPSTSQGSGSSAQAAAAARYTRKLPSTTTLTSPATGLPLGVAALGLPTGRPMAISGSVARAKQQQQQQQQSHTTGGGGRGMMGDGSAHPDHDMGGWNVTSAGASW